MYQDVEMVNVVVWISLMNFMLSMLILILPFFVVVGNLRLMMGISSGVDSINKGSIDQCCVGCRCMQEIIIILGAG